MIRQISPPVCPAGLFTRALAGLVLVACADPTIAQDQKFSILAARLSGSEIPTGSSIEDVLQRRDANLEQASLAEEQLARNAASAAEYERRKRDAEEERARIAAQDEANQAAFAAARSVFEAEKARVDALNAKYEADMARWEADVAACKAGDYSRCARN